MSKNTNHIQERVQGATMLVAFIVAYAFAITVLLLDMLVWRPW